MFGTPDLQMQRAHELGAPPPKGQPYSVPIPGSQIEGRSAVYRNWRFVDKPLLETLDPAVWSILRSEKLWFWLWRFKDSRR